MKKNLLLLWAILTIGALPLRVQAQTNEVQAPILRQLAQKEPIIIEGRIRERRSFYGLAERAKYPGIFTARTVDVYKVFRGNITTAQVEIVMSGGDMGDRASAVLDGPGDAPDGTVGIFLCRPSEVSDKDSKVPVGSRLYGFEGLDIVWYDLTNLTAGGHFENYGRIKRDLYPLMREITGQSYQRIASFPELEGNEPAEPGLKKTVVGTPPAGFSAGRVMALTDFNPKTVTAGTYTSITITGSGFGTTKGTVQFRNADETSAMVNASYFNCPTEEVLGWNNTQIIVRVPSGYASVHPAGTGLIKVITAGANPATYISAVPLTVTYAVVNREYPLGTGQVMRQTRLRNLNGTGGVTFRYDESVYNLPTAVANIQYGLELWRKNDFVNFNDDCPAVVKAGVRGDGVFDIIFEDANAPVNERLPASAVGLTTLDFDICTVNGATYAHLKEANIIFRNFALSGPPTGPPSSGWHFTTDDANGIPTSAGATEYDFESVALHELGHVHQVGHCLTSGASMYPVLAPGQSQRTLTLANDVAAGNNVLSRSISANPAPCNVPPPMTLLTAWQGADFALSSSPAQSTTMCDRCTRTITATSPQNGVTYCWTPANGLTANGNVATSVVTFTTPFVVFARYNGLGRMRTFVDLRNSNCLCIPDPEPGVDGATDGGGWRTATQTAGSALVQVFPNPATTACTIRYTGAGAYAGKAATGAGGLLQAEVVDIFGRAYGRVTLQLAADGGYEGHVSTAALPRGVYTVRIFAGDQVRATTKLALVN